MRNVLSKGQVNVNNINSNPNIKTFVNFFNFFGYDCVPNFWIVFTVLLKIDLCFFCKFMSDL